jgi:hypothetical protein
VWKIAASCLVSPGWSAAAWGNAVVLSMLTSEGWLTRGSQVVLPVA